MSAEPKLLDADTVIADGDVLRLDWDGHPRFYHVRLYDHDPRECPMYQHLYTPQRKVYVELEGDPTAHFDKVTEDDPEYINEAVLDCVAEIEWQCEEQWERESYAERLDCLTSYEKSFGY